MNTKLIQKADEYHALAHQLRECGHEASAEFYQKVGDRFEQEAQDEPETMQ